MSNSEPLPTICNYFLYNYNCNCNSDRRMCAQVTFRDPESARLSCIDAAPVIDGRRANCNLASLGVQRSARPTTPQNAMCVSSAGRNLRPPPAMIKASSPSLRTIPGHGVSGAGGGGPATTFLHYAFQQGSAVPYSVYGYVILFSSLQSSSSSSVLPPSLSVCLSVFSSVYLVASTFCL